MFYTNRILVIDLKAVLHVIKFGIGKGRLTEKEKSVFIIHGFLLKLKFMLQKTKADTVVYALDSDTSKRQVIYPAYKGNRQNKTKEQEALDKIAYPQFDQITDYVIPTLGYRNSFGAKGYEADDMIGMVCKTNKKKQIVIVTTDKDMYQLLGPGRCILNPKTNQYYTQTKLKEEFGIMPKMWKRVKAIGGCSSDNVQGVPIPQPDPTKRQTCVAEKGALNFITGKMKPTTRAYQAIVSRSGKDVINRNKSLVILPFKGTPIFPVRPDHPRKHGLIEVCERYEFNQIIEDIDSWKKVLKLR